MSIKNYIDSSRDLTMVNTGHATALAAHLRLEGGNISGMSSFTGSKQLTSAMTKGMKDSSGMLTSTGVGGTSNP